LNSDLARDHRLVAMDLRGHGLSEKPLDSYGESKLWADDIHGVIQSLNLDHPILCGWSYGPLLALDYIRHYGEDAIGGIHFVGGITKLGTEAAVSVITPEMLGLIPQFFSSDADESVRGVQSLLRLVLDQPLAAEDWYLMTGYGISVPPHVRRGLFSRVLENDDLLPNIHKPVLITHGSKDRVVKVEAVSQHRAGMPHAQLHIMEGQGHACFWEDAASFNRRLQEFCSEVNRLQKKKSTVA
jgi:pimeloyl-ACP methyl ester carboxylesterase